MKLIVGLPLSTAKDTHQKVVSLFSIFQCFQNIPMFLPVMRGTLSLPALRDPEVLERLQPSHVINMCSRLQVQMKFI